MNPNPPSLDSDLPSLVTAMVEKHVNSPLKPEQKALLNNRLNQLLLKTPDHPPYSAMIHKALVELSDKGGSSEESISKFLEKEYKDLPVAHLTFLKHHLAKLCESGDITLTCGNKYVLKGISELKCERQERKGTEQPVQQRKLSLKATVKINKRPVKRVFKWDYEMKQKRLKKLRAQRKNQRKNDKVKVTGEHLESNNVQENQLVEAQTKEYTQEHLIVGPETRANRRRLKERRLLSMALRRSKRLQNDFTQENEVEKQPDLSVEHVTVELECSKMHGPRNTGSKANIHKLPVKTIFKWDWERKQKRLKLLAQKSNLMNNDESKVAQKHSECDVQENGWIQEEIKELSEELVMEGPLKRTCRNRLKRHGQLSETIRRSKRLRHDSKQEKEVGKKYDFIVEPTELLKDIQIQPRHSTIAGKKQEIMLSCELQRPQVPTVDLDLQHNVPELQEKSHAKHPLNQEDVVVNRWGGIVKVYRRRSKEKVQARTIAKKEVEPRVSKTQTSPVCIDDLNDDQSLGSWIRRKRLRSRQQKSKGVKEMDEAAAGSCSAMVVRTGETLKTTDSVCTKKKLPEELPKIKRLKTTDSVCNGTKKKLPEELPKIKRLKTTDSVCNGTKKKLPEELPKIKRLKTTDSVCNGTKKKLPEELPKIKQIGRPPKGPRSCGIIIGLMANNAAKLV